MMIAIPRPDKSTIGSGKGTLKPKQLRLFKYFHQPKADVIPIPTTTVPKIVAGSNSNPEVGFETPGRKPSVVNLIAAL
jgi:hypothetical protein